jgi:hypothetical protein
MGAFYTSPRESLLAEAAVPDLSSKEYQGVENWKEGSTKWKDPNGVGGKVTSQRKK